MTDLPTQARELAAIPSEIPWRQRQALEAAILTALQSIAADAREAALREAIEAVREGYDPEFTTIAENAIRALLATPAGETSTKP